MQEDNRLSDENVKTGGLMPLVSIRNHYKISIAVFLVIFILGLPYAWLKGKAVYSATAVIYVAPRFANILKESREQEIPSYQQYRQFVKQQTGTINRYDIVSEALEKLGERRFLWQKPDESNRRAAERLQAALSIKEVRNTYLITITLEGSEPDGLDEIVNTVVETYLQKTRTEGLFFGNKERLETLQKRREVLMQSITAKRERRLELSQELGVTTFVDNNFNPYDRLLSDLQQAYAEAQRDRLNAKASLRIYESDQEPEIAKKALDATVGELITKDQGLYSLKANLNERKSRLLQEYSGLNQTHPLYRRIKKQLEDLDAEVISATEKLAKNYRETILEQRRSNVRLAEQIEQDLLKQIKSQKERASWFATRYNDALSLNRSLERDYLELEAVENRINFLELESKAPGFIRMESSARAPEIPIGGGRKKLFSAIFILAVFSGLGIPVLIDFLDRRIRTSGQVTKIIGFPPLAEIFEPTGDRKIQQFIAYQKRRLLFALQRELRSQKALLIQMTSVEPESHSTSLAFDLAREFSEFNIPAIVIELNTLKPDKRYLSQKKDMGLLNLMQNPEAMIEDAVSPAKDNLPDRMPLRQQNAGLLHRYDLLADTLAKLQKRYPVVILDTAPILLSADSEYLAGIADISLLVVAAMKVRFGELKRAVRLLEKADPVAVSYIVTRLQVFHGSGYYEKMVDEYDEQTRLGERLFTENSVGRTGES